LQKEVLKICSVGGLCDSPLFVCGAIEKLMKKATKTW